MRYEQYYFPSDSRLIDLLFDPEDGDVISLRNANDLSLDAAQHPRRQ
jgi:hypothetical protein